MRGSRLARGVLLLTALLANPAFAQERDLDTDAPPSSAKDIDTPIARIFPEVEKRPPLFPWIRDRLAHLPPFFSEMLLEARYRTYYLRQDRTNEDKSEAWAMGGSIAYQSGWIEDAIQIQVEGFTSQPVVAPDSRDGTLLLQPGQDGITVLGIANAKVRYGDVVLTGFRQYLDLPYVNRQDNRMIPNTFEAITLAKTEGALRFSAGYAWTIKTRFADDFDSFTASIGLDEDRGYVHAGVLWMPHEDFEWGAIASAVPDLYGRLYTELGIGYDLARDWQGRFDAQFTYQDGVGEDLLGDDFDEGWILGLRAAASRAGFVARVAFSVAGPDTTSIRFFGTDPSYIDLMQRTFTRADEKALLFSLSYDFGRIGAKGLTMIVNFAAGFDGEELLDGRRRDAQELDVTLDYRIRSGWLESFWLRLRGSWLHEENTPQDGSDFRVILRYDIPVI